MMSPDFSLYETIKNGSKMCMHIAHCVILSPSLHTSMAFKGIPLGPSTMTRTTSSNDDLLALLGFSACIRRRYCGLFMNVGYRLFPPAFFVVNVASTYPNQDQLSKETLVWQLRHLRFGKRSNGLA